MKCVSGSSKRLPVFRPLQKFLVHVLAPECLRKLRHREIVTGILQRSRRSNVILVYRHVASFKYSERKGRSSPLCCPLPGWVPAFTMYSSAFSVSKF